MSVPIADIDDQRDQRRPKQQAGTTPTMKRLVIMRKLIGESEADQIKKLEAAGMLVTGPDLGPFRDKMGPACARIAACAGADNVKKLREMVEQSRKA